MQSKQKTKKQLTINTTDYQAVTNVKAGIFRLLRVSIL